MILSCDICPHNCVLEPSQVGKCQIYQNTGTEIENKYYGLCSFIGVEDIEKKPFFHFYPGSKYLAVGLFGCSLACQFCVPGDTLITTTNGPKRIDQIVDGEEIIVFDNAHGLQQLSKARIGHVVDREVEEVLEIEVDGQSIQLTPEHPLLTKRGWVEAKDLTVDDEVLCDKTY